MDVACGGAVPEGYGAEKPSFDQPGQVLGGEERYAARIATSCGEIAIDLFAGESPFTANSFAFLAGEGFYDATIVHRVVPGFVIQMGDPTGTGSGGPGYRFTDELQAARDRGYPRGTVAMANSGPDTNGSQFFICLDDLGPATPGTGQGLPPSYAVFGEVTDGMDVADRIAAIPCDGETPREMVFVVSVRVQS